MTRTAIKALTVEKDYQVLEFGGEIGLSQLLQTAVDGHVSGVEISATMLVEAKKLFQTCIFNHKLPCIKAALRPWEGTKY